MEPTSVSRRDSLKEEKACSAAEVDDVHKFPQAAAEKLSEEELWKRDALGSLIATAGLEGCDDQLLPASFRALEEDLHFSPMTLGSFTLVQTFFFAISCPFWGRLCDIYSRKNILAAGTIGWGFVTIFLALVSNYWIMLFLRGLNGIALASVVPTSQSILADILDLTQQGFGFGLVQMADCAGRMVGGVATTTVATRQVLSVHGWRVAFVVVGSLSVLLGMLVMVFIVEPPRRVQFVREDSSSLSQERETDNRRNSRAAHRQEPPVLRDDQVETLAVAPAAPRGRGSTSASPEWELATLLKQFRKRSILVILAQGTVGAIPLRALSFGTLYFQYCGLPDWQAGVTIAVMLMGVCFAGPLGGMVGDAAFRWSPNHGRVFVAQLSICAKLPIVYLLLQVMPRNAESFPAFCVLCFFAGALGSWTGVAVTRPVLSEIVDPRYRASTFATTIAIESGTAALLGAPMVGILAETVFGYKQTDLSMSDMSEDVRQNNAEALGNALSCMTLIPWALAGLLFNFLHLTLPKDRMDAAKYGQKLVDESLAEGLETDRSAPTSARYGSLRGGRQEARNIPPETVGMEPAELSMGEPEQTTPLLTGDGRADARRESGSRRESRSSYMATDSRGKQ